MDITKEPKSSFHGKTISSNDQRHLERFEQFQFLTTEKNFVIGDHLGEGSYGEVFRAKSPDYKTEVALKIVCPEDVCLGELIFWPTFDHQNILPLLDIMEAPYALLFITPLLYKDMETLLEEESFIYNPKALNFAKTWLREILDALDYLHRRNLYHLDIKADNVLIDYDYKAVLCDFSFINHAEELIGRYGVPIPYRPPETCLAFEKEITVDAVSFEMWSYGILALNVLTGHFLKNRLTTEVKYWHKDIYPLLFEANNLTCFRNLMVEAFPLSNTLAEFTNAFNFVQYILRLHPTNRPSVEMTYQHIFLKEGGLILEKPDDIWLFYDISSCFCECLKPVKSKRQRKEYYDHFKFRNNFKKSRGAYKKKRSWVKHSNCLKTEEKTIPSKICKSESILKHNDGILMRSILVENTSPNKTPDYSVLNNNPLQSHTITEIGPKDNFYQSFAIGDVPKSCKTDSCIFDDPAESLVKDIKIKVMNYDATRTETVEETISDLPDETKHVDVKEEAHTEVPSPLVQCGNYEQDKEETAQRTENVPNVSPKNSPSNSMVNGNPFPANAAIVKRKIRILEWLFERINALFPSISKLNKSESGEETMPHI